MKPRKKNSEKSSINLIPFSFNNFIITHWLLLKIKQINNING